MYLNILILALSYRCVCPFALGPGPIALPGLRALDSRLKSHAVETALRRGHLDGLTYTREGVRIKLPGYSRPKRRLVTILGETAQVDYAPLEDILERVKDMATYSNFANIRRAFLEVAKWVFFRRKEAMAHPAFTELRRELLARSSLFGAVYARLLRHLLKSSNLYGGFGIRNGLKHYIRYRDGVEQDSYSLSEIARSMTKLSAIPQCFFSRLLKLCLSNDRVRVLESVLRNSVIKSRSLFHDMFLNCPKPIVSDWGLLSFSLMSHSKTSVLQAINKISRPDFVRSFDHIKTGESDLEFSSRHFGTVLNLFSHVYKVSKHVKALAKAAREAAIHSDQVSARDRLLGKLKIRVIGSTTTPGEMAAVYYSSLLGLNKLGKLEDLLCIFLQIVDYINRAVQSGSPDPEFLTLFIDYTCRASMNFVKRYFSHMTDKLDLICSSMFSDRGSSCDMHMTKYVLSKLTAFGLDGFSRIFREPDSPPGSDRLYGIMEDSFSKFVFDFQGSTIIASSHPESMDSKNFRGNFFDGVTFCHLLIQSSSDDPVGTLSRNYEALRRCVSALPPGVVDSNVTLDLPKFDRKKAIPYGREEMKVGTVFTHPVNSQLLMTVCEW